MRRLLFLLLIPFSLFSSNHSPGAESAALQGEPSSYIEGCVSAITGGLIFKQDDFIVRGASPITLRRHYTSHEAENPALTWHLFYHGQLTLSYNLGKKSQPFISVNEPDGFPLRYIGSDPETLHPCTPSFAFGRTNTGVDYVGGNYHPRGNIAKILDEKTVEIRLSNGGVRTYKKTRTKNVEVSAGGLGVTTPVETYHLAEERLSNGHILCFTWISEGGDRLKHVSLKNPSKTKIFSSIDLKSEKRKIRNEKGEKITLFDLKITGSDTRAISYTLTPYKVPKQLKNNYSPEKEVYLISEVQNGDYPDEFLAYSKHNLWVKSRSLSNQRKISVKYDKKGRVEKLIDPCGETFTIEYEDGKTTSTDPMGNKTLYFWDETTSRLEKIEKYAESSTLLSTEAFEWSETGELLSRSLVSPTDTAIKTRSYKYDDIGNPIEETFSGQLTSLESADEKTTIKREYSDNGFNLLLREEHPNGKTISYKYEEGTNLPKAILTSDQDRIWRRTFYEYNDDKILVKEIHDDSTSSDPKNFSDATVRLITEIDPITDEKFYGMPKTTREYFYDGEKNLLRSTDFTYNKQGLVIRKVVQSPDYSEIKVFDFKYDNRGRLTSETNPIKQKATYSYDNVGNKTNETTFAGQTIHYAYNNANALTEENIEGHATNHTYNTLSQRTSTTDYLDRKTKFSHDPLGNLLKTTYPDQSTLSYEYDAGGNPITTTDPRGNATRIIYNSYNQPLQILHPDGTKEENTYTLSGELESHTDQEGVTTSYTYDIFGRELTKTITKGAETLSTESKEYSGWHLTKKIDPLGRTTTYTYDRAGKLLEKTFLERSITYTYDQLGREATITQGDTRTSYAYDSLDRVIEEIVHVGNVTISKTTTTYTPSGEVATQTTYPGDEPSTDKYTYDIWGRETAYEDPLGQRTLTSYEKHTPEKGPPLLKITTTDPLGRKSIQLFDFQNNPIHSIQKSPQNKVIANWTKEYDPSGNLTKILHTIYPTSKTYEITYQYDALNRKISETEQGEKTTHFTYTPSGLLKTHIKPDGTQLNYTYTPLGYLSTLQSTGLHYTYTYDKLGNLLTSKNETSGATTTRLLDEYSNILEETLGNGLSFNSSYDTQGRRIKLILPTNTTIEYGYEGPNLRTVQAEGYTHTYEYNQTSTPISVQDILGNTTEYTLDKLGKPTTISGPHFFQEITYNKVGNISAQTKDNFLYDYTYDTLDQLISEPGRSYSYDSLHNRLSFNDESYKLNHLNQLSSFKDESFTYDKNGNLTQTDTLQIEYDPLDRPIAFTSSQSRIELTYDAEHRRLSKTLCLSQNGQWISATTRNYLWEGNKEVGFIDSTGETTIRILGRTPHAEIGASILLLVNNTPYAPVHDLQGNLLKLVDQYNVPIYQRSFTAFGEGPPTSLVPWGFSSKTLDPETDLIYFGRRFYSPTLGRFITPDPEHFTDGCNLYHYTQNNPLTRLDPHGLLDTAFMLENRPQNPITREDLRNFTAGSISGISNWVVNTSLDWSKYAGGVYGTEDMSFSQMYNSTMEANTRFRQEASTNINQFVQNSFNADLNSAFYHYGYQSSHIGADLAYATLIPMPKGFKEGKAISSAAAEFRGISTQRVSNAAGKFFRNRSTPSATQIFNNSANQIPLEKNTVQAAVASIEKFLGGKGKMILNSDNDLIIMKGTKKIRFDVNNAHGTKPHFHIEYQNPNGRWKDAGKQHRYFLKEQ